MDTHILAIPLPAQGHVIPMKELSKKLARHGFKFTFVNTEFIHSVVIYVAFESSTIHDEKQAQEIALGLELTGKPFLWVLCPGINKKANEELACCKEQIEHRGRVVSWAPQEKVLCHPSVACFMSHCGWNSTMEGVSNGVPFLCWPYFADQFLNERFICDAWKVGLGLEKDENTGIIRKDEILNKVNQLLSDMNYKSRAMVMKEKLLKSVNEGSSHKNWSNIIEWIKKW